MAHHRRAHSDAVARLGRRLARGLGADQDLVEAGCLAHDLGHPPFGHDGERALAAVACDSGGFEANAQTLRILTRLAGLTPDTAAPSGLHLTRATLDAACKYPWTPAQDSHTFGAYAEDLPALEWLRAGAPDHRLCLEAQIMDWADDVANGVHDFAYNLRRGRIPAAVIFDPAERTALADVAAQTTAVSRDAVGAAADRFAAIVRDHDMLSRDGHINDTALTTLTTHLLRRYVIPVIRATTDRHGIPLFRYHADLVIPQWAQAEIAVLAALTLHYVLRTVPYRQRRARRIEQINALVHHLIDHAPDVLAPPLRPVWLAAPDDAGRLRVVIDHIAALTDAQATVTNHRTVVESHYCAK